MSISLRIRTGLFACLAVVMLALFAPMTANAAPPSSSDQYALKVYITDGPTVHRFTTDRSPTFKFRANQNGATFKCRVDYGDWYTCWSPFTTRSLKDGYHDFYVKASREGEYYQQHDEAHRRFLVDHDFVPDTVITYGPADRETITGDTPLFKFQALNRRHFDNGGQHSYDPNRGPYGRGLGSGGHGTGQYFDHSDSHGATFQCRIDAGLWYECWSPHTTASLTDGLHTFAVRAIVHFRTDPTPATRTFTVDRGIPDTYITGGPTEGSTSSDATPEFTFVSNRSGSTFTCSVDGAAFACSSPYTTGQLADGQHTFKVAATNAGLTDPSPDSRSFLVDVPGNGVTPPPFVAQTKVTKSKLVIISSAGRIGMTGTTTFVLRCSGGDNDCIGRLKLVKTIRFRCDDRFCYVRRTLASTPFTIRAGSQKAVKPRLSGNAIRMVYNTRLDRMVVLAQATCDSSRTQRAVLLVGRR